MHEDVEKEEKDNRSDLHDRLKHLVTKDKKTFVEKKSPTAV